MTSLLEPLSAATNTIVHRLDERFVELGFRTAEYLVLWAILSRPHASASEIRILLGMRDAAFSNLVARAVARGYVRELKAARDRRSRYLELTRPGRTAVQIARTIHLDVESVVGAGPALLATYETLVKLHRVMRLVPPPERLDDGLPVTTA
ncbi:MAG: MarR family winged helix-turn-helix transcriptional regulator [Candidatus Limnocylindrales bacterium]